MKQFQILEKLNQTRANDEDTFSFFFGENKNEIKIPTTISLSIKHISDSIPVFKEYFEIEKEDLSSHPVDATNNGNEHKTKENQEHQTTCSISKGIVFSSFD